MKYLLTEEEFKSRLTPKETDARIKEAKIIQVKACVNFLRGLGRLIQQNDLRRSFDPSIFRQCGDRLLIDLGITLDEIAAVDPKTADYMASKQNETK